MKEIRKLEQALREELPTAVVGLDPTVGGPHFAWLDIEYEGKSIAVEWRRARGFGVSVLPEDSAYASEGLFQGPDQVFPDWRAAKDYILLCLADAWRPRRAALA